MNKPRHRKPVELEVPKPWQEIVKAWPKVKHEPTTSPNTLALRGACDYTPSGRPTSGYLTRLVHKLPMKKRRLGMGRANLRRLIRDQARHEERVFEPKTLPAPIWRNVNYAFRRFNPEGLARNLELANREAA